MSDAAALPTDAVHTLPATKALAFLSSRIGYVDLPHRVTNYAKMMVASTVASAALGTQVETARVIRNIVCERAGVRQASLWFEGGLVASLPDAVRLNAMRSSAAASDDSDLRNLLHAGTAVVTAALASAEQYGRSGKDVVRAVAVGYEVAARVAAAVTPGFRDVGFHGCIASIFGSAVASGLLMRLSVAQMTQAIALAGSTVSGLLRSAEVSNSREHQDTMAATLGVEVALAALHGFEGDEGVLDGEGGYFEVFGRITGEAGRTALLADFGYTWALAHSMAIKLVPGGHPFHTTAEATEDAIATLGISGDDVASIRVAAPGLVALRGPIHPSNLLEMAHSQAYFAAAAAVDGKFSWVHAKQEKITDPAIHLMIDRVSADLGPCEAPERYRLGATVTVEANDGRSAQSTAFEPRGSGLLGVKWDDVDGKFRALVPESGMSEDAQETALQLIHELDRLPNIQPLVRSLSYG